MCTVENEKCSQTKVKMQVTTLPPPRASEANTSEPGAFSPRPRTAVSAPKTKWEIY